jgi:hypothetical protein
VYKIPSWSLEGPLHVFKHDSGLKKSRVDVNVIKIKPDKDMTEEMKITEKQPKKESAIIAPMRGMKLEVPLKIL